jgi:hypothetical protein
VPEAAAEEPVLAEVEPEPAPAEAARPAAAPEPEGEAPAFRCKAHALGGDVIALSDEALYVADLGEKEYTQARAALKKGRPAEEVLEGAKTVIPFDRMRKVESNLHYRFVDMTWRGPKAGEDTETNVLCPDPDSRDELMAILRDRLGPDWKREVIEYSRLRAAWQPLVITALFGFLTFCFVMATLHPEEGDGRTRVVRTNWIGAIFVWAYNLFGPAAPAILGGPFLLGGVVWLVMRLLKPPVMLTLRPRPARREIPPNA